MKKMWCIYIVSLKNKGKLAICNNMDESWGHAKQNKSVGQIMYDSTYLRYLI